MQVLEERQDRINQKKVHWHRLLGFDEAMWMVGCIMECLSVSVGKEGWARWGGRLQETAERHERGKRKAKVNTVTQTCPPVTACNTAPKTYAEAAAQTTTTEPTTAATGTQTTPPATRDAATEHPNVKTYAAVQASTTSPASQGKWKGGDEQGQRKLNHRQHQQKGKRG